MSEVWHIGAQYGIRINQNIGPWIAFGVHTHIWPPRQTHIDLHFIWWLVTIGRHYHG